MARPDKRRPMFLGELRKKFAINLNDKDMVLSINVLHKSGAQSSMKWTERQANEAAARSSTKKK